MTSWFLFAAVLVVASSEETGDVSNIAASFINYGITTDIIPAVPEDIARIDYLGDVCLGEELKQTDVIYLPRVTYNGDSNVNYTVMLIDPDIPSIVAPALRSALHWMVINIPGNNTSQGTTAATYVPPVTYPGSGCHRFILLVYAQSRPLDNNDRGIMRISVNRFRFSVSDFVNQYGLNRLVGGNLFWTCSPPLTEEYYCKS